MSSGVFYDPDPSNVPRWKRLGHLGIEMEAAMLYTIAAVKRVEALAMMTVSDIVGEGTSERISDDELRRGVDAMMRVACRVADELTTSESFPAIGASAADSPSRKPSDRKPGQIEAELLDRVALLDELGDRGVDLAPAVVVDLEALHDLVVPARARDGKLEMMPSGTP